MSEPSAAPSNAAPEPAPPAPPSPTLHLSPATTLPPALQKLKESARLAIEARAEAQRRADEATMAARRLALRTAVLAEIPAELVAVSDLDVLEIEGTYHTEVRFDLGAGHWPLFAYFYESSGKWAQAAFPGTQRHSDPLAAASNELAFWLVRTSSIDGHCSACFVHLGSALVYAEKSADEIARAEAGSDDSIPF